MKRFIKKFFGEKSSNNENQDALNSSVIEDTVVDILIRTKIIICKKDDHDL